MVVHFNILFGTGIELNLELDGICAFAFEFHIALFHIPLARNVFDNRKNGGAVLKILDFCGDYFVGVVEGNLAVVIFPQIYLCILGGGLRKWS